MQEIKLFEARKRYAEAGVPEQILRLRWKLLLLNGNEITSEWTAGTWPSWTKTWHKHQHESVALVIEAQHIDAAAQHFRMGIMPASLVCELMFLGINTTSGLNYVAGICVITKEVKFTFLCNGAINEEKL
jgi:hypothetical protein